MRWRERLDEEGCHPSTVLLEELPNVCARMLDKYDTLFTIAHFDWIDPGSPMKLVIFIHVFQAAILQSAMVCRECQHWHADAAA